MTEMPELYWSESEQAVMRKDRESGYYIVDSVYGLRGWFPGSMPTDAVRLVPETTRYMCAADQHVEGQERAMTGDRHLPGPVAHLRHRRMRQPDLPHPQPRHR